MTHANRQNVDDDPWVRWLQRVVIALAAVIFCSCRAPSPGKMDGRPLEQGRIEQDTIAHSERAGRDAEPNPPGAAEQSAIQQVAYKSCQHAGDPGACPVCAQLASGAVRDESGAPPPLPLGASHVEGLSGQSLAPPLPCSCPSCAGGGCGAGGPLPCQACGQWHPPGIVCPWPEDEYLCDGGDRDMAVAVAPDWSVYGLETEDAVAHFDTLDGRTLVEPSNRVCVYAPRFAAVRTVTRIELNEQADQAVRVALPTRPLRHDDVQIAASSLQREQPERQVSAKLPEAYESRQGDGVVSIALHASGFQDIYLPFEDFDVIRSGRYDQTDKARLAQAVAAAVTWTNQQAAQVILDRQTATALVSDQRAQVTYVVDDLRHNPKLRLIKVASTQDALPGETVDFTLRFDNVGDQTIGNVVIIDSLTTRLEYVPGSSQASVDADFRSTANEGQSLVLRWEITKPIKPGDGGIIRFQCKVR